MTILEPGRPKVGLYPGFIVGTGGTGDLKTALDSAQTHLGHAVEVFSRGAPNNMGDPTNSLLQAQGCTQVGVWAVPLVPMSGGSITDGNAGAYDALIDVTGAKFALYRPTDVMRVGWEFSGNFYPWGQGFPDPGNSGVGNSLASIHAMQQRFVNRVRAAGFTGPIDINGGTSDTSKPPVSSWWPGDAYGDIIGMDVYNSQSGSWPKSDMQDVWDHELKPALDAICAYARAHGKWVGIGECGVLYKPSSPFATDDNSLFWKLLTDYARTNADVIVYLCAWNENIRDPTGTVTEEGKIMFSGSIAGQSLTQLHDTSTHGPWTDSPSSHLSLSRAAFKQYMIPGTMDSGTIGGGGTSSIGNSVRVRDGSGTIFSPFVSSRGMSVRSRDANALVAVPIPFNPPTGSPALTSPSAPTLSVASSPDAIIPPGTYQYSVAAYAGSTEFATVPGPTSGITVAAGQAVTASFATVAGATGYIVYVLPAGGIVGPAGPLPTYTFQVGTTTVTSLTDQGLWAPTLGNTNFPQPAPALTFNASAHAGVVLLPIKRISRVMPLPSPYNSSRRNPPANWYPISEVRQDAGYFQVTFGTTDVTYFRGIPCEIENWESQEPGDDASATIKFPQIGPYERVTSGQLQWFRDGTNVDINIVRPSGAKVKIFEGLLASYEIDSDYGMIAHIQGALFQTDEYVYQPSFDINQHDVGTVIANILNGAVSHNYAHCAAVTTGVLTSQRGAWGTRTDGWMSLLPTAFNNDGTAQWTLMKNPGRVPVIRKKNVATVHYTVALGAPGIKVNLTNDWTMQANVIYGEGVNSKGGVWRNTKYPGLTADTSPVYPLDPSANFTPGGSAAGFQAFSDEMRILGYDMQSQDTYLAVDESFVKQQQTKEGILVDGIVGPQTWAAVFNTGSNVGSLDGVFFQWLSRWTHVEPKLYDDNGIVIGNNPEFDPTMLRVERYENFGEGVTKNEAVLSAIREVDPTRIYEPMWVGSITLDADPEEMSRFEMKAGRNIFVKYFQAPPKYVSFDGAGNLTTTSDGILLHISRCSVDPIGGTVTLDVSYQALDHITLAAIKARKREAADPMRRVLAIARKRSGQTQDQVAVWDSESGAGVVPRMALPQRLWVVIHIPAGQVGNIAAVTMRTTGPASKFAFAIFDRAITSDAAQALIGNPFAVTTSGFGVMTEISDAMINAGVIAAWGQSLQGCGYYPLAETTPLGTTSPLTGRFYDSGGWTYASTRPPWLWVAMYADQACYIQGQLEQAVLTS